jgi:hypothetical protein
LSIFPPLPKIRKIASMRLAVIPNKFKVFSRK